MSRDDFYASPLGAAYSAYMERPRLSRPLGRLFWGGDTGAYYESMAAVGEVGDGATIVDCPCGAGPALRALEPGRERPLRGRRPLAGDAAAGRAGEPQMRGRGRDRVRRAKAEDLPLEAGSADLFLSYWGMHCFPDPRGGGRRDRPRAEAGRAPGRRHLRHDGPSLRQRLHRCGPAPATSGRCARSRTARVARASRDLGHRQRTAPASTCSSTAAAAAEPAALSRARRPAGAGRGLAPRSARAGGRGARPSGRSRGRRASSREAALDLLRLHHVPDRAAAADLGVEVQLRAVPEREEEAVRATARDRHRLDRHPSAPACRSARRAAA